MRCRQIFSFPEGLELVFHKILRRLEQFMHDSIIRTGQETLEKVILVQTLMIREYAS